MNVVATSTSETLENILFPVVKVKSNELMKGTKFTGDNSFAIYAPTEDKVLHFCPPSYDLEPNDALILPIYDKMVEVFGKDGFTTKSMNFDDCEFSVTFTANKTWYQITKEDAICPEITISNSYNGRVKRSVSMAYWRKVCENGMMGWGKQISESSKHYKGTKLRQLSDVMQIELEGVKHKVEKMRKMTERTLLPGEFDKLVEEIKAEKNIKFPVRLLANANETLEREATEYYGGEQNVWLAYNALNNVLYHGESALRPHEREKIDHQVLHKIAKDYSFRELLFN